MMPKKLGKLTPGQWHTIVFKAYWHKLNLGVFKVWLDKKLVVNELRSMTFFDSDDRLFEFRVRACRYFF